MKPAPFVVIWQPGCFLPMTYDPVICGVDDCPVERSPLAQFLKHNLLFWQKWNLALGARTVELTNYLLQEFGEVVRRVKGAHHLEQRPAKPLALNSERKKLEGLSGRCVAEADYALSDFASAVAQPFIRNFVPLEIMMVDQLDLEWGLVLCVLIVGDDGNDVIFTTEQPFVWIGERFARAPIL